MPTPEEIKAQQDADAAVAAKALADAEAAKNNIEVDLPGGIKVALPKDQAEKVIHARDAGKEELRKALASSAAAEAVTKELADLKATIPGLTEASKRLGDLTVKVTELEAKEAKAKEMDTALAKILETRLADVPDGMKGLVKGETTIDKFKSLEELTQAGVFKTPTISSRKPGEKSGLSMTASEFNALPEGERAKVQELLRTKQMAPLTP